MVRLRKVGRATVTAAPYQRADLGGDTNACENQAGSDSAPETLRLRPHKKAVAGTPLAGRGSQHACREARRRPMGARPSEPRLPQDVAVGVSSAKRRTQINGGLQLPLQRDAHT
jgi:hypothetical protein